FRAAIVVGVSPLGGEPTVALEAVQRGVQRPFLDEEVAVGDGVDPLGHGVAMPRAPAQRFENEDVERAAEQAAIGIEHGVSLPPLCQRGRYDWGRRGTSGWDGTWKANYAC